MNWYKIETNDGNQRGYTYVGTSPDSIETLVEKATKGEYLRLDDLLYQDSRGDAKEWAQWDKRLVPTVYINPATVKSIMAFKADPRTLAR